MIDNILLRMKIERMKHSAKRCIRLTPLEATLLGCWILTLVALCISAYLCHRANSESEFWKGIYTNTIWHASGEQYKSPHE